MLVTSRPMGNANIEIMHHDDNNEDEVQSKTNEQLEDLVMPQMSLFRLPSRVTTPISSKVNAPRMITPSSNH